MENKQENNQVTDWQMCPVEFTMNRIAGKWKLVILWHIYNSEIIRYGELKRSVHHITHKMLSNQLKELMAHGLVHKKLYNQVPPKTEYSLTEKGRSLIPILDMLHAWGTANMDARIPEDVTELVPPA